MQQGTKSRDIFILILILLCLGYMDVEFFLNKILMFSVDDFWFAHRAYEYRDHLPYRDIAPYKTVLGYYILLVPMLFANGIINTLVITKNAIALLNAIIFFTAALMLRNLFSKPAILASLAALLVSDIVLSYSTNIRVDLFAYWFCLFAWLTLLPTLIRGNEARVTAYLLAGALIGLGFVTSQKALWYWFATVVALGIDYACFSRNVKTLLRIVYFNFAVAAVIGIYLAIWSWVSDANTVINSVFLEASAMYQLNWYEQARLIFWTMTINTNPLLFLLLPVSVMSIFVTQADDVTYRIRCFAVIGTLTILFCLIPYRQVFPYYMQVLIPAFFILYAAFFTWLIALFQNQTNTSRVISKPLFNLATAASIALVLTFILVFKLPLPYLITCLIPIGIYLRVATYQTSPALCSINVSLITACCFIVGFVYPITTITKEMLILNGQYQRANMQILQEVLKGGGDYVAGMEMIYNRTQPIAGMKHLMGPAIDYLHQPTNELRRVMLASLDEDPTANVQSILTRLKEAPIKSYVNNYRMDALPAALKQYFADQFTHYYGSIYIYAPLIKPDQDTFNLKFDGNYRIAAKDGLTITINDEDYPANSVVHLSHGTYKNDDEETFRLVFMPDITIPGELAAYEQDDWLRIAY